MKYRRFAIFALALLMLLPLAACALKPAETWPEALKPSPGGRAVQGNGHVETVSRPNGKPARKMERLP